MNKTRIALLVSLGAVAYAVMDFLEFHKEQQNVRDSIAANADREIQAIKAAQEIVLEKIRSGDYDGKPFQDVLVDHNFYTMAYHLEQE